MSLIEGQEVIENADGYSAFGETYRHTIQKDPSQMSDAESREHFAEWVRCDQRFLTKRPSRLRSFFAALTVEDALWFGNNIAGGRDLAFPVYEVHSSSFTTLDMNWLDYPGEPEVRKGNCECYWWGEISNHNPQEGPRRPPRLEVLVRLPTRIGKLVAWSDGRHIP